ncbi:FtsX-like permease family protein [Candidatus Nomurabacteria bacterium]|nr:FtsX-like permease family protein [Candidatus Nomurabacteria bacterium]
MFKRLVQLGISLRVGAMLGWRQVRYTSVWTTVLIIMIMTLTFLNLVAVSGILEGIVVGANRANEQLYTGGVFLRDLPEEDHIVHTQQIISTLEHMSEVKSLSARSIASAVLEANALYRRDFDAPADTVPTSLVGVDPDDEEFTTNIAGSLIEGQWLDPRESGSIIIGASLLRKYSAFDDLFEPLEDIFIGDVIKVSASGQNIEDVVGPDGNISQDALNATSTQEFVVKGILDSKVGEVSTRVFITESDFRRLTGRNSLNADEIAVRVADDIPHTQVKSALVDAGFDRYAKIQTAQEAIPKFLSDIKTTFGTLGNIIGSIGIIVASITIFIVIYINAITRRKYIGILKAIGIHRSAIIFSYVLQAMLYAGIGALIGLLLVYGVMVPGIAANPIDFPFADGVLVAPLGGTLIRMVALFVVTALAGLVPAWLIVRQNTLNSILGR